jgi:hypothetical protein
MNMMCTADTLAEAREVTRVLIAKQRDAMLVALDDNFDRFATAMLQWVIFMLEETKAQRPVLNYWPRSLRLGALDTRER